MAGKGLGVIAGRIQGRPQVGSKEAGRVPDPRDGVGGAGGRVGAGVVWVDGGVVEWDLIQLFPPEYLFVHSGDDPGCVLGAEVCVPAHHFQLFVPQHGGDFSKGGPIHRQVGRCAMALVMPAEIFNIDPNQ